MIKNFLGVGKAPGRPLGSGTKRPELESLLIGNRLRNHSCAASSSCATSSSSDGSRSENTTPGDDSERNPLDPVLDEDFDGYSDDELVDNASETESCEEDDEDDEDDLEDDAPGGNLNEFDGKPSRWYQNENSLVVKALKDFQKKLVEAEKAYAEEEKKKGGKVCKNEIIKSLKNGNMWFNSVSSSPEIALTSNWVYKNDPSPTPFYGKKIFVFAPHITFKDVQISCYHCDTKCIVSSQVGQHGDKTNIRLKGWTASPRKCYGRDDIVYVFDHDNEMDIDHDNGLEVDSDLEEMLADPPSTQEHAPIITFANVSAHVGASAPSSSKASRIASRVHGVQTAQPSKKRATRQCITCQKYVYHVCLAENDYPTKKRRREAVRTYLLENMHNPNEKYNHVEGKCPFEEEMKDKPDLPR